VSADARSAWRPEGHPHPMDDGWMTRTVVDVHPVSSHGHCGGTAANACTLVVVSACPHYSHFLFCYKQQFFCQVLWCIRCS
jgi:hypothetical protein